MRQGEAAVEQKIEVRVLLAIYSLHRLTFWLNLHHRRRHETRHSAHCTACVFQRVVFCLTKLSSFQLRRVQQHLLTIYRNRVRQTQKLHRKLHCRQFLIASVCLPPLPLGHERSAKQLLCFLTEPGIRIQERSAQHRIDVYL